MGYGQSLANKVEEAAEPTTNRCDADRLANEWLVEETVELAEDQQMWYQRVSRQTSTSLRTVKSNMPSSVAHLTNGANRTLMRATIASLLLQPQFQVQFLLLPLDGQDHHSLT